MIASQNLECLLGKALRECWLVVFLRICCIIGFQRRLTRKSWLDCPLGAGSEDRRSNDIRSPKEIETQILSIRNVVQVYLRSNDIRSPKEIETCFFVPRRKKQNCVPTTLDLQRRLKHQIKVHYSDIEPVPTTLDLQRRLKRFSRVIPNIPSTVPTTLDLQRRLKLRPMISKLF